MVKKIFIRLGPYMGNLVGYAYLIEAMALRAFPVKRPAYIRSVTRVKMTNGVLAVPRSVAPAEEDYLAHILFALKYEGVNLAILAQALPRIDGENLVEAISKSPSSAYLRKVCFLWESFTDLRLDYPDNPLGTTSLLFNPKTYITGPPVRNRRWRVDFNGLGTIRYCATVERTVEVGSLLAENTLGQLRTFMESQPKRVADHLKEWAYLSETDSSFAIEKQAPDEQTIQHFAQLLREAHECPPLTEAYLVTLQNAAMTNSLDQAVAFRTGQNYLSNGLGGALGVTYVPPPAELCNELMIELMTFANQTRRQIDPLVAAGITAFGFALLHPFVDGNGRLSRFLIHHTLCCSDALADGLLLPVSVSIEQAEQRYLEALQSFSKPARQFWDVRRIDAEKPALSFTGDPSLYRYWDATECVIFTLEIAKQAIEVELKSEKLFLERFDALVKVVNEHYDVRGSLLTKLVKQCLHQHGFVSQARRKQYQGLIQDVVFDFLEGHAQALLTETRAEPHVP